MSALEDALPRRDLLLEVQGLRVEFDTERGTVHAVNDVGFGVKVAETLAIVGESGSGKTVTSQAIMGTLQTPPGHITAGSIRFHGRDLLKMRGAERRRIRGRKLTLITQDALTALNPVFTVGFQIGEVFRIHLGMSRREARRRSIEALDRVGIPAAASRIDDYPHQFSGGMQQRVMIAMAVALEPEIIIADEPTTALDVTVQAQIIDLLTELKERMGLSLVLISHDLALVSTVADRIVVMYGGGIVESGPLREVYARPAHPYTRGLLRSIPAAAEVATELHAIPGYPPDLLQPPDSCAFAPRCSRTRARCTLERPAARPMGPGRTSACHYAEEELADGRP